MIANIILFCLNNTQKLAFGQWRDVGDWSVCLAHHNRKPGVGQSKPLHIICTPAVQKYPFDPLGPSIPLLSDVAATISNQIVLCRRYGQKLAAGLWSSVWLYRSTDQCQRWLPSFFWHIRTFHARPAVWLETTPFTCQFECVCGYGQRSHRSYKAYKPAGWRTPSRKPSICFETEMLEHDKGEGGCFAK